MKDITTEEAVEILKGMRVVGDEGECEFVYDYQIQAIEKLLNELEKKDKIINAMALQLSGISIWDDQKEEPLILMTEEEVKQYFEKEVKDEKFNNR